MRDKRIYSSIFEAAKFFSKICEKNEDTTVATMAMAAFDESGKLSNAEYVVFGGSVASIEAWGYIVQEWDKRLASHGIPYLSMKEAMKLKGPFEGWEHRTQERDLLLIDLAKLLHSSVNFHVVSPVKSSSFKNSPESVRRGLANPQYIGFEGCMKAVVSGTTEDKIAIYCDSSEEYSPLCLKMYLKMRNLDEEFKNKCVSLTFAEDEHFPPLQAADMVAYCARTDYTRTIATPQIIIESLIEILKSNGKQVGSIGYVNTELGTGTLEGL